MDPYVTWLLLIGVACFGAAWVPHLVRGRPISFPILYVALGAAVFSLPIGLPVPDPLSHRELIERFSELVVIVSLTGVALKLDRPIGLRSWGSTWRLLAVTMPICIAAFALLGWWAIGLTPAAAVLLGAALAPTDPVLASEVQAPAPHEGEGTESKRAEVRFALTSEAGLNDGLAFPFTNLAIVLAAGGSGLAEWAWRDVGYKVAVGVVAGWAIGAVMTWLVFRAGKKIAEAGEGIVAIALTLVAYAATEMLHGYGFLAVFVAALTLRHFETRHEYHRQLHDFGDDTERILMAVLLVLLGGALVGGLLRPLTWPAAAAGLAFVLLIRPVAGLIGLAGSGVPWKRRAAISFFGIRGVGSVYYLAYALGEEGFRQAELLWATVGFVILISIVIHGFTATTVMARLEPEPEPAAK